MSPANDIDKTPARGKGKKKKKIQTDLLLARNPKNAYPVYQLLKKSERLLESRTFGGGRFVKRNRYSAQNKQSGSEAYSGKITLQDMSSSDGVSANSEQEK